MATARALDSGGLRTRRISHGTSSAARIVSAALDAAAVAAALLLAAAGDRLERPATVFAALAMAVTFAVTTSVRRGRRQMRIGLYDDVGIVVTSLPVAVLAGLLVQAFTAGAPAPSATPLLVTSLAAFGALLGARAIAAAVTPRLTPPVPTLIVGAGNIGRLVAQRLLDQPALGLQPVGFLDKNPLASDPFAGGQRNQKKLPVFGASWDLEEVVREQRIGYVVVTFSTAPTDVLLSLIRRCENLGIQVALVPRLFERVTKQVEIHHLGGLPLLQVRPPKTKGISFTLKHVLDRVLAALLVPLLAPSLIIAAAGVWLSLGRPIFFRQRRIGRDGKPFDMLKFRTMHPAAESTGPVESRFADGLAPGGVEGADRRTIVGAILRRTSLDELPQLLNVLKGEMSFVGPRPERPEFVELFNDGVYRYQDRHRVKAGITGWSQVNGLRGKTSIQDRAEWDNYYIENWTIWMDVRILALTLRTLFLGSSTE